MMSSVSQIENVEMLSHIAVWENLTEHLSLDKALSDECQSNCYSAFLYQCMHVYENGHMQVMMIASLWM